MTQFIDRPPTFGEQLAQGLGSGFSQGVSNASNLANQMILQKNKHQQEMALELLKSQGKTSDQQDFSGVNQALDTLEGLLGKTGIGKSSMFNPLTGFGALGEASKNRGLFESTQAAILPLFKSLFPRGMTEKEFKFIQEHYIPQATDTESKIQGKIQGLRQLINKPQDMSLLELQGMPSEKKENIQRTERPPLSSFHR